LENYKKESMFNENYDEFKDSEYYISKFKGCGSISYRRVLGCRKSQLWRMGHGRGHGRMSYIYSLKSFIIKIIMFMRNLQCYACKLSYSF
jgi:hypothetical protein